MPTISSTLSLAKRALLAHQAALAVGSDNIANVNTPGYARRRADLQPAPTDRTLFGGLGTGVELVGLLTARDQFVEQQLHRSLGESASYDTGQEQLHMIEGVVAETGTSGLRGAMDAFWNAWHDLSTDPSSTAQRTVVRQTAQTLVQRFHDLGAELTYRGQQLDAEIAAKTGEVNQTVDQLAQLNREFMGHSEPAANLEDRRTQLLDKLAQLVNIQYQITDRGTVSVFTGGVALVMDDRAQRLEIRAGDDGRNQIFITGADVQLPVAGGQIGALFNVRDVDLVELKSRLDRLATTLATEVNKLHTTGYALDGSTGNDFFAADVTGIGNIKLSDAVTHDVARIAAGGGDLPGDNRTALAIAGLETSALLDGGNTTIGGEYSAIAAWLGARVADTDSLAEGAKAALDQAKAWRDSVSGVSLDEEMADMIRYQQAFTAAAKIVTVADTMMESVIALIA
jgi:flagellar hook-associated protein 1 FlgK